MKRLLTVLLLTTLVVIPLRAEKWALLVGINGYQNNISPLRFCLSDVNALRQVLIDPQIGAFKADNVWLMTDDSRALIDPPPSISWLNWKVYPVASRQAIPSFLFLPAMVSIESKNHFY